MDEPISWESDGDDVLRVIRAIQDRLRKDCETFRLGERFSRAAVELNALETQFGYAYLDRITAGPSKIEVIRRLYEHEGASERHEVVANLDLFETFIRRIYRECRGADPRW